MTGRDKIILQKIANYIAEIAEYIASHDICSFMKDKKTISACAFNIGQVGELANHVSDETREKHSDIPWRSIRGMRNRIVHDYDNVDMAVLWGTITKSLPELADKIYVILNET